MAKEEMVKLRLITPKSQSQQVIDTLYDYGAIQVTRCKQAQAGTPLDSFKSISEKLINLRSFEKTLGLIQSAEVKNLLPLPTLIEQAGSVEQNFEKLRETLSQLSDLRSKKASLSQKIVALNEFKEITLPNSFFENSLLDFRFIKLTAKPKAVQESMSKHGVELAFLSESTALIAFDKKQSAFVLEKLSKLGQVKELPKISSKTFSQEIQSANDELAQVNSRIVELAKEEQAFKKSHGHQIVFLIEQLQAHSLKAGLPNKFSQTTYLDVIEGWVQKRFEQELIKMITKTTENKVFVEKIESKEQPPVQLTNNAVVKPFEFLTRFFSLPNAGEGDPSIFLMIFFPIIFGMILGDIGYGFAGLALSVFLFLKIKSGAMHSLAGAIILASVWTIFFGYIFGEIFGGEHFLGVAFHPIIERGGESLNDLIILALVMGIIHLAVGLLLGVYYNVLHRHYSHAIAKLAWLVVEFSFVIIGLSAVSPSTLGPTALYAAVAGVLIATAAIVKIEGIGGAFELPGMLANVLSYLRIMALGLSGVILAKIVNVIPVGDLFESVVTSVSAGSIDPIAIITALLMFVLVGAFFVFGHGIALVLGLFESSIQSLRLQYVEFFSKYYKGGGQAFVPLRSTIKTR